VKLFAHIVNRITYPLNERREGTRVLPHLRSLGTTQFLDPDRLHDLRLRKLRAILEHAFHNTVFYRKRFHEAGITPDDIRDFDDLRRLPRLTKDDVVYRQSELKADNLSSSEVHWSTTGGSTGTETPFCRDNKCLDVKLAAQYRFNQWCGWDLGEKVAVVWPAFQDLHGHESWKTRLKHVFIDRHQVFDASRLNERIIVDMARRLDDFAPVLIRAFPSPLRTLAEYLRDAACHRIRPAGILTTGEPLLPHQREMFGEVFDCPVFNCYASRESGHIASECEKHQGLHINAECLHLEFERGDAPVLPGEAGHVLVTDFENYGMPFIRYEIGDMGAPLAGQCECGRTLPRMAMEAGRVADFLLSPHDDSLIPGIVCCEFIAKEPDVEQIQIIQDARDHLTVRVKMLRKEAWNGRGIKPVEEMIQRVFHGAMRFTFEQVESIPQEKSGKYRVCINRYLEKNGL
jgi:phenylacetate-CoA ligase